MAATRLASLRDDEACCRAQIKAAKLQKGPLAVETLRGAEVQLRAIGNEIRMPKPIQKRLKELQKSERDAVKIRDDEITRTNAAKEVVEAAYVVYEQCQKDLAKAEDDVVGIKAQVSEASIEKADFEASRPGAKAGDIMTSWLLWPRNAATDFLAST